MRELTDPTDLTIQDIHGKHVIFQPIFDKWVEEVIHFNRIDLFQEKEDDIVALIRMLAKKRQANYSPEDIRMCIRLIKNDLWKVRIDKLKKHVKFVGPNDSVTRLMKLIAIDPSPVEQVKLVQTLWLIKRKLHGLDPEFPSLLSLYGDQGSGKSVVLDKIFAPFEGFIVSNNISALDDDKFSGPLFEENYVFRLEELGKLTEIDSNSLKQIISNPYYSQRGFHSRDIVRFKNNITIIGSSNESLGLKLRDITGSRRFLEIQSLPKAKFIQNHKAINAFNYLELWQSIDENAPAPIINYRELIYRDQEMNLTPSDHFKDFADDILVKKPGAFTPNQVVDDYYHQWLKRYAPNIRMTNRSWLIRRLVNMGFEQITQDNVKGLAVECNVVESSAFKCKP